MKRAIVFAKILKGFSMAWAILAFLFIMFCIIGIFTGAGDFREGWLKFTEVFSPFNVMNYVVLVITFIPAIGAYALSERILKTEN